MVELVNISYIVDEKKIIDDISLKININDCVIITGENGSGKSTLAKIIMGIIKPTCGKIYFNNIDITELDITSRAKLGISLAFQQPVVFKGINIKEFIKLANKNYNENDIKNIIDIVGIDKNELTRDLDSKFSGGELKRIELASVLARESDLVIYDEPEAGIDLWSFNSLIDLFYSKKGKQTEIIISHQQKLFKIADYVIVLKDGKIEDKLTFNCKCNKNCCGE